MQKQRDKKKLIPTLLATVYAIPALACADDQLAREPQPAQGKPRAAVTDEALKQEVIQLLRQGETDRVTMNVAGQPGVYFRLLYSTTGDADSYVPVPDGQGRIGEDGVGSLDFELRKLGTEEVYFKVRTSDTADFTDTRVTPEPMILEVEQVEVKARDAVDDAYGKIKVKIQQIKKKHEVRTPSAVAGVRG
ncbi:hypothetical protein [Desulfatitalea tepidiphila]|uniref:hypothetical protein n=1 Tax=Desulfatitalea tepidiphila TaxID=1185843 RepID=UPI0006B62923|nr:hypothetical protein [Desulfatitalea tepidiphila]